MENIKLNNGLTCPVIGIGTFMLEPAENSVREALYKLLETKNINDIKVIDLTRAAGVSRGAFYKHFYLITDVLRDDIRTVAADVRKTIGPDIALNWDIILKTVYQHKKKIPLLLKAGMAWRYWIRSTAA